MHRLGILLIGALMASLLLGAAPANAADGAPRLVGAFGKANIGGQEAFVHTVSVVGRGQNASAIALESLAAQGARPISKAEYSLNGLKWGTTANPNNSPNFTYIAESGPDLTDQQTIRGEFAAALDSWKVADDEVDPTGVNSLLVGSLRTSDTELECPSLVRECPGRQTYDGSNDVGWADLKGSTLGVAWYNNDRGEVDIALDLNQPWYIGTEEQSGFDIQTVALHEFGHGLGLGHSNDSTVMRASYGGFEQTLGCDDILGLADLYGGDPGDCSGGDDPPTTTFVGPMTVEKIDYVRTGRGGRDLNVTVTIVDSSPKAAPIAGADQWIELTYDNKTYSGGPVETDSSGQVTWRVRRAPEDKSSDDASTGWTATVYVTFENGTCDDTCTAAPPAP